MKDDDVGGGPPGYLSPGYAASLREFGRPLALARSGGHLLERDVPGEDAADAMGCYPLFTCADWSALGDDLRELEGRLVSVAVVVDPFSGLDEAHLSAVFRDVVLPLKQHFVIDTTAGEPGRIGSKDHRYKARRALRRLEVVVDTEPSAHLDGWCALYDELVERHAITGIRAFSRRAFAEQLALPGIVMFRALLEDRLVGAHLWYVHGDVATSHLVASSAEGYELRAAYAIHSRAIEWFTGRVRWMNVGGGAGARADATDGLTQFKRGWSTDSRTVWLCGRVLDRERYAAIAARSGKAGASYFPVYRAGEFG